MDNKKAVRIDTLEWLRGLMALSIMFYHICGWEGLYLESNTILGRLGIYGVSIFFILSGLSMAIVYNSYIVSINTAVGFIIRRVFRIWPLLWLACFYLFFQSKLFRLSTYGVYLLHPIIYFFVRNFLNIKNGLFVLIPLVTIFVSFFLYKYFELKFINIGKELTSKKIKIELNKI